MINPMTELLVKTLTQWKGNKISQAMILQAYISEFGPVPDEYGEQVRLAFAED